MKVILLMTISPNGYIARKNDEAPWSSENYARFHADVKKFGNLIVGKRTYEILKEDGDLDNSIQTVVLSEKEGPSEGNVSFVASPQDALQLLRVKGFETAVVAGGSKTNTGFLEAGLIDEIILDVEPLMLGDGVPLFGGIEKDTHLQLLHVSKLDENAVRLHYKVVV